VGVPRGRENLLAGGEHLECPPIVDVRRRQQTQGTVMVFGAQLAEADLRVEYTAVV
jgi:hypothetical protein